MCFAIMKGEVDCNILITCIVQGIFQVGRESMALIRASMGKGLEGLCAMALGLLCLTAPANAVPSLCDSVSGNLVANWL